MKFHASNVIRRAVAPAGILSQGRISSATTATLQLAVAQKRDGITLTEQYYQAYLAEAEEAKTDLARRIASTRARECLKRLPELREEHARLVGQLRLVTRAAR